MTTAWPTQKLGPSSTVSQPYSTYLVIGPPALSFIITMGGFGLKSRNKQAAPAPLSTNGKPTNKKRKAEPIPADELEVEHLKPKKSKRTKVPRSGGKSVSSKRKARELQLELQKKEAEELEAKKAARLTKQDRRASQDGSSSASQDDEDEDQESQDEGLEAARECVLHLFISL